jgi:hypothetical protein
MVIFEPPRRKPRRKRARVALLGADRSNMYAGLLHCDEYAEAARAALIEGNDGALRNALSVLAAIVEVVTSQLRGSSSVNLGTLG